MIEVIVKINEVESIPNILIVLFNNNHYFCK